MMDKDDLIKPEDIIESNYMVALRLLCDYSGLDMSIVWKDKFDPLYRAVRAEQIKDNHGESLKNLIQENPELYEQKMLERCTKPYRIVYDEIMEYKEKNDQIKEHSKGNGDGSIDDTVNQ